MSVIAVSAYIFSQTKTFKNILNGRMHFKNRIIVVLFFAGLSILGTYMNIEVNGALANTRPIGAAVAGLFGGPVIGASVGLIAGYHRYMLGGFTGLACGIATIFEGLVGGVFRHYNKGREPNIKIALLTGVVAESLQMLIIIIAAKPFEAAVNTVSIIALPMIISNSIGIAIFVNILRTQLELSKLEKRAQMATTAELKVLQAQIHPHFLFNALNTIASFCRTDPSKARELIINLSTFFRKTLNSGDGFVTIEEEIDLVNSYLSIEKARFGERLSIMYNISDSLLNIKVPAFIIQPFVENSIKHGISPKPDGGEIEINVSESNGFLTITISDTGIGMSQELLDNVLVSWPGIGLKNVNERLKNFYGDDFGLTIKSLTGVGTRICFRIPK